MSNGTGWMHHDWTMMGYGWGGILFWVVVSVMVIIAFGVIQNQGKGTVIPRTSNETPHEILEKRYARGDISKEEFDRMKRIYRDL